MGSSRMSTRAARIKVRTISRRCRSPTPMRLDGSVPVESDPHMRRRRLGPRPRLAQVEHSEAAHRLRPEYGVLERGERRSEREVLLHHPDARPDGIARVARRQGDPVRPDRPRVLSDDAGSHSEQRALARAIFSHDGVHAPRIEVERDRVHRVHGAEALVEAIQGEERCQRRGAYRMRRGTGARLTGGAPRRLLDTGGVVLARRKLAGRGVITAPGHVRLLGSTTLGGRIAVGARGQPRVEPRAA